jgi:adenylate cyclase
MDYTVVGDTVNVAQRLEAQTRKYHVPIIVSDKTAEALPDMLFRELDTVMVKGRSTAVTMLQPLGAAADVDEVTLQALQQHQEAMLASRNGDWARARALFEHLRDGVGPRPMYELYLRGIDQASGQ